MPASWRSQAALVQLVACCLQHSISAKTPYPGARRNKPDIAVPTSVTAACRTGPSSVTAACTAALSIAAGLAAPSSFHVRVARSGCGHCNAAEQSATHYASFHGGSETSVAICNIERFAPALRGIINTTACCIGHLESGLLIAASGSTRRGSVSESDHM